MESTPYKKEADDSPQENSFWGWLKSLLRLRGAPDTTEELEHEIQELLEEGEEQGLISSHEERLINSIFGFRETMASEIMTPSAEIVCAEKNTSVSELIQIITEEGYTRIPIYEEIQDQVIGVLHAKDLLRICARGADFEFDLVDFLKAPSFIQESKPITELLREFQSQKIHMAIVVDEFGSVRGIITLEDVIEEIVGEIDDEHDQDETELRILDEDSVIVDAKIDIEEVEAHFDMELPEGPYESIGGFIIHQLEKVPQNGAVVESGALTFKVLGADNRRINSVRISRVNETGAH